MSGSSIITNNFWAKLIALVLAIATWFYIFDMVNQDSFRQKSETTEEVFSRYNFIVKELPVKPVFSGKSPDGYRVMFDKVRVEPSVISILGPEDVINDLTELNTESIDLGEYTRSAKLTLGLDSDVDLLDLDGKVVNVYVPVEFTEADAPKAAVKEPVK